MFTVFLEHATGPTIRWYDARNEARNFPFRLGTPDRTRATPARKCHVLKALVNEADGTRTRNHRIDSPVL